MDIAKIRKKAQAEKQQKQDEEQPVLDGTASGETGAQEPVVPEQETAAPAPVDQEEKERAEVQEARGAVKEEARADEEAEDDVVEVLTFALSTEEFAFRVSDIEEIVRFQRITSVPTMPDFVLGITSLRGKIIPVINLKTRLNIQSKPGAEKPERRRMIGEDGGLHEKIVIVSGPKGLIGATIDKVIGVLRTSAGRVLPPPGHLSEEEMRFIEGVVISRKRFISILRAEDLMDIEAS